jgi:DNA invertase Pin-like site-specific DNA recombinase
MEIAYTLYRVSTKQQVDKMKDDIPMQREACREFAEKMGWTIGKEFLEKRCVGLQGFGKRQRRDTGLEGGCAQ